MKKKKKKIWQLLLACVANVSVWFRSKERGTRVKDRAKNGVSKRASFRFHRGIFIKWWIWAFCHVIYTVNYVTKRLDRSRGACSQRLWWHNVNRKLVWKSFVHSCELNRRLFFLNSIVLLLWARGSLDWLFVCLFVCLFVFFSLKKRGGSCATMQA